MILRSIANKPLTIVESHEGGSNSVVLVIWDDLNLAFVTNGGDGVVPKSIPITGSVARIGVREDKGEALILPFVSSVTVAPAPAIAITARRAATVFLSIFEDFAAFYL